MTLKRKPPTGNVRRVASIGKNIRGVTTNKRGRLVQFESEQERKLILLLERDVTVTDYMSQPETLTYYDKEGRERRYTPDFQVWRSHGCIEIHEVTIEQRQRTHPTLSQRASAAVAICQQRGWEYHIHTEKTLPAGYEYANLDFLSPFRAQMHVHQSSVNWWLSYLARQEKSRVLAAMTQVPVGLAPGILLNTLYHLLWHDQIQMDWQQPFMRQGTIHPAAAVWLPSSPLQPSPARVAGEVA
jgi:hypothetical protein